MHRHFRAAYAVALALTREPADAEDVLQDALVRAYERLAMELVAPRGRIDLVVSDNVDYANGSATVFPSNRIVVYVHPPIESRALRFTDDWIDLVMVHELAHIFHIDRTRGTWRLLQGVFGRSPLFFPNAYTPRWLTEGIATYYESRLTHSGRVVGTSHRAHLLTAGGAGRFPRIDEVSVATPVFPGGQGVYIFGSMFIAHIAETRGDRTIPALIERQAVHPLPFLLNRVARAATGQTFTATWKDFATHYSTIDAGTDAPMPEWLDISEPLQSADFLRWMPDGRLVYTGSAPRRRRTPSRRPGRYDRVRGPGASACRSRAGSTEDCAPKSIACWSRITSSRASVRMADTAALVKVRSLSVTFSKAWRSFMSSSTSDRSMPISS